MKIDYMGDAEVIIDGAIFRLVTNPGESFFIDDCRIFTFVRNNEMSSAQFWHCDDGIDKLTVSVPLVARPISLKIAYYWLGQQIYIARPNLDNCQSAIRDNWVI